MGRRWWAVAAAGAAVGAGLALAATETYRVSTPAMEPALACKAPRSGCTGDANDRVLVLPRFLAPLHDGDVVVYRMPREGEARCGAGGTYVHRVAAVAGGRSGAERVPREHLFVVGDNLAYSCDSRAFGPIEDGAVVGRVALRIWPPSRFGRVD